MVTVGLVFSAVLVSMPLAGFATLESVPDGAAAGSGVDAGAFSVFFSDSSLQLTINRQAENTNAINANVIF